MVHRHGDEWRIGWCLVDRAIGKLFADEASAKEAMRETGNIVRDFVLATIKYERASG